MLQFQHPNHWKQTTNRTFWQEPNASQRSTKSLAIIIADNKRPSAFIVNWTEKEKEENPNDANWNFKTKKLVCFSSLKIELIYTVDFEFSLRLVTLRISLIHQRAFFSGFAFRAGSWKPSNDFIDKNWKLAICNIRKVTSTGCVFADGELRQNSGPSLIEWLVIHQR